MDAHEWVKSLAGLLERLIDRYRRMTERGLLVEVTPSITRADAVRMLAQRLADAARGIELHADGTAPTWHDMPDIGPLSVGDQLAVAVSDLVDACAALPPGADDEFPVWTRDGRRALGAVIAELRADIEHIAQTA